MRSFLPTVLLALFGCSKPEPPPLEVLSPSPIADPVAPEPAPPPAPKEDKSMWAQLRAAGVVALFAQWEKGVVGVTAEGEEVRVIDEQVDWIIWDPSYGVLWLNRAWETVEPGLFVTDLRDEELRFEKFSHFTRTFSMSREGDFDPIPTSYDPHPGVYTVVLAADMSAAKILVKDPSLARDPSCPECEPNPNALALLNSAWKKGRLPTAVTLMGIDGYSIEPKWARCSECGRKVLLNDAGASVISLPVPGHPGDVGWQFYDDERDEFVSIHGERSRRPWGEGDFIQHVMVCAGSDAIILNSILLGPDLVRVSSGHYNNFGQCLEGGRLFLAWAF
jgi:hypothetical protein